MVTGKAVKNHPCQLVEEEVEELRLRSDRAEEGRSTAVQYTHKLNPMGKHPMERCRMKRYLEKSVKVYSVTNVGVLNFNQSTNPAASRRLRVDEKEEIIYPVG